MQLLTHAGATDFLKRNGVTFPSQIDEILRGFDLNRPLYAQSFYPGDALYQYIRNPSLGDLSPGRGAWFCLAGATTAGLAIMDGGAGRRLHKFKVRGPLTALEGTAAKMATAWSWSGGGPGGATQIYVPPASIGRITAVAAQDR